MEIKDICVAAERMEEVRGGATILQGVINGSVTNDADISIGSGSSGQTSLVDSPVTSVSTVGQLNNTVQTASATDTFDISTLIRIDRSQFSF